MNDRQSGQSPHVPPVDLTVFRVEKEERHQVRTLAGTGERPSCRLLGYLTHWRYGASRVCLGPGDCDSALHKIDPIWYAYLAVERWDEESRLWIPCVLQVTESLELDMRGKLERGQYWSLSMAAVKKKGNATRGELSGRCDQDELPLPFDVLPVVRAMFHCAQLQPPKIANPAPGRIALAPSGGAPPPGSLAARRQEEMRVPVESQGTLPTFKSIRERMEKERANGNGQH